MKTFYLVYRLINFNKYFKTNCVVVTWLLEFFNLKVLEFRCCYICMFVYLIYIDFDIVALWFMFRSLKYSTVLNVSVVLFCNVRLLYKCVGTIWMSSKYQKTKCLLFFTQIFNTNPSFHLINTNTPERMHVCAKHRFFFIIQLLKVVWS